MVDEGCYKCIKYLIVFFNVLFLLAGCAMLGVGVWLRVDPNGVQKFVDSAQDFEVIYTASYLMIGVGAVVIIISFLGCCGAIKESTCLLGMFFVLIMVIFFALLVAGIILIIKKDYAHEIVDKTLGAEVKKWNDANDEERKKMEGNLLDVIQAQFNCCGNKLGRADYGITSPASCKIANFLKPCYNSFTEWLSDNLVIATGLLFGIAVLLVFGMVFSMILCCSIRRSLRYST